jgi:uncharacterized protein YkwD
MGHKIFRSAAALFFLLAAVLTPGHAVKTTGNPNNVAEQFLLAAANQERAVRGLHQLHFDPVLAQAALYHANEMAEHDAISHQFPGEPDLAERGARVGAHFSVITENVAEASDSSVIHDLWMHSPGHRANLLDPTVEVVGIAVVVRNHQFYAVEDFANTIESLSFNQQEETVASLLAKTGLHVVNGTAASKVSTTQEARRTCSMSSGYAGQHKPWFIMRFTADRLNRLPDELESRISSGKYHQAVIGACADTDSGAFTSYNIAVLLYP